MYSLTIDDADQIVIRFLTQHCGLSTPRTSSRLAVLCRCPWIISPYLHVYRCRVIGHPIVVNIAMSGFFFRFFFFVFYPRFPAFDVSHHAASIIAERIFFSFIKCIYLSLTPPLVASTFRSHNKWYCTGDFRELPPSPEKRTLYYKLISRRFFFRFFFFRSQQIMTIFQIIGRYYAPVYNILYIYNHWFSWLYQSVWPDDYCDANYMMLFLYHL